MITTTVALVVALSTAPTLGVTPCADCHPTQDAAWQRSLHSRSMDGPLYRAMRNWARRDAGEKVAALCVNCHSTEVTGDHQRTLAVTCEVCHQGEITAPTPAGLKVLPSSPVAAQARVDAPHPVRASRRLISGEICLACHHQLHNPRGVPLCTTGPETEAGPGGTRCLTCHMPGTDHTFAGTTPEVLARAATLHVARDGDRLFVTVLNRGSGHALPTGSPLRRVVLTIELADDDGRLVGRTVEAFARVLEDEHGNAPAPPWRAHGVQSDTRLGPFERRVVEMPVADGASRVTATLTYHRAPPKLLNKLGLTDAHRMQPVEMARLERDIPR